MWISEFSWVIWEKKTGYIYITNTQFLLNAILDYNFCHWYLFFIVVFQCSFKALLHPLEGNTHICSPPHLTPSKTNL